MCISSQNIEKNAKMWKVKYPHLIHWYMTCYLNASLLPKLMYRRQKKAKRCCNKILLKMVNILQRNCIMNDVPFSTTLSVSFLPVIVDVHIFPAAMNYYITFANFLLLLPVRQTTVNERSLSVLKCLLLRTRVKMHFETFWLIFFSTYKQAIAKILARPLNLLFSLTFIYSAFAASDMDRKKNESHRRGSVEKRRRVWWSTREMTESDLNFR